MIVAPKSAVAPPARVALWRDEGGQNSAYGPLRRPFYLSPITNPCQPSSCARLLLRYIAWLITSSPAARASSGPTFQPNSFGRGHRVRVADSLITGKRSNLDHISEVEFLEGDLADADFARRAAEGCDYVLHQAAIPSVPRSVKDPITSNRANVDATLNMLVAARDAGVKRLVFAASSSAYGDTPTLPKHERMPTGPLSPYALQKVVGEQYLQMFTRLYGLETVSIRYFNVFGARQDPSSPYSG